MKNRKIDFIALATTINLIQQTTNKIVYEQENINELEYLNQVHYLKILTTSLENEICIMMLRNNQQNIENTMDLFNQKNETNEKG